MKKTLLIAAILSMFSFDIMAQSIPTGVYTELAQFQGLSADYIQQLPKIINSAMRQNEVTYHKNLKSTCVPRFDVQYINQITKSADQVVNDFESGFISLEVTFCFMNTASEKVLALFFDRQFQADNVSTIKQSYVKDNTICEKTYVPTIGDSHYCYTEQSFAQADYILGFTFNVWNDSVQNANAPVYFREVMASAAQTQNMTRLHMQTYVRGPKLNFFQKAFAKDAISSEQKSVYEKMKQRLQ